MRSIYMRLATGDHVGFRGGLERIGTGVSAFILPRDEKYREWGIV
jgi:hypothetical protein